MKEKLILHKESALIACDGVFTGLERKFYNFLLFHAKKTYFYKDEEYWDSAGFDGADTANNFANYFELRSNEFEISLKELLNFFNFEINEAYALELIKDIFQKEIAFNILEKDKVGKWKQGHRFSHAITEFTFFPENKVIKYSLPAPVFSAISQESDNIPFAKINLLVSRELKSKFAAIIYEIISDYLNAPKIPEIKLGKFKKLLGLKENYAFCDLKRRCLDPALSEINENPYINFSAKYEIIRNGQTPTAVKFKISKNSKPKINNNNDELKNHKIVLNNSIELKKYRPTQEQKELAIAYLSAHPDHLQADILRERYGIKK